MTSTETPTPTPEVEKYAFSADINQLLGLIINTFYSNKDIFLRELISNASDALDKIRYASLTDSTALGENKDLEVHLTPDKEACQLVIRDFGIGMTKQELVNNLGTIAKSGTKSFMEALQAGADVNMIGQFGVGFYSAFLVADRVDVHSKSNSDDVQWVWSSTAGGSFSVEPDKGEALGRGTKMVLHMKPDMAHYLEEDSLRKLVRKHSDFIDFLIKLRVDKSEEVEVTDSGEDEDEAEDESKETPVEAKEELKETPSTPDDEDKSKEKPKEEGVVDSASESGDEEVSSPKKKTKKLQRHFKDWEPLNYQKPLWTRRPDEITHEEYASFYKAIANDYEEHLAVKHFSVEGQIEFKSLLFVPKRPPFDLYDKGMKQMDNIKLYVRRVFIMDKVHELMPQYLCFIKGVVDSEDLPLNVSREVLQQNKITRVMRKHLTKRSLELIQSIAEDEEKYLDFYSKFGKNIKLGIHEDTTNKEKLTKLLRFQTLQSDTPISFENYIERMPEGQKAIYYISGESLDSIRDAPFMEQLQKRGYDVMLMVEPMDEYCMNQIKNFEEKPIVCVTKEGLELGEDEEEKKAFEERVKALEPLCTQIKEILDKDVEKVIVSPRLVTTPCVLVTGAYGWTANMERLVKAQALTDQSTQVQSQFMATRKTLEIHPEHPVIRKLESMVGDTEHKKMANDVIRLMFDTALLSSGFTLPHPTAYANHINRLIGLGLEVDDIQEWEATVKGKGKGKGNTLANEEEIPEEATEGTEATETTEAPMEEVD